MALGSNGLGHHKRPFHFVHISSQFYKDYTLYTQNDVKKSLPFPAFDRSRKSYLSDAMHVGKCFLYL